MTSDGSTRLRVTDARCWPRRGTSKSRKRDSSDELIGEEDQVAVPRELTGIHQGEYTGVAPSGKQATFRGLASLRVADSKIVEDVA